MAVEKDILEFGISTDTPETKKTTQTLSEMLMFPARLAQSFTTQAAIYAWTFNQISQAVTSLYDLWAERQRKLSDEWQKFADQMAKGAPSAPFQFEKRFSPEVNAQTAARLTKEYGGAPVDVQNVMNAIYNVLPSGMNPEDRLESSYRSYRSLSGQASPMEAVQLSAALSAAYGIEPGRASAIASTIIRMTSGENAQTIAAMIRRAPGSFMETGGDVRGFLYPNQLISGVTGVPRESGTATARLLESISQSVTAPGGEKRLEDILGADVFDQVMGRGVVKDWPLLQQKLVALAADPSRARERQIVFDALGKTIQSRRGLSAILATGMRGESLQALLDDPSISNEIKEEVRGFANRFFGPDIAKSARNLWNAIGSAEQTQANMLENTRVMETPEKAFGDEASRLMIMRPPIERLKQQSVVAIKKMQESWNASSSWYEVDWTRWTQSGIQSEVGQIAKMSREIGLTPEEEQEWIVAHLYARAYGEPGKSFSAVKARMSLFKKDDRWGKLADRQDYDEDIYAGMGILGKLYSGDKSLPESYLGYRARGKSLLPYVTDAAEAPVTIGVQNNYSAPNKTEQAAVRSGADSDNATNARP